MSPIVLGILAWIVIIILIVKYRKKKQELPQWPSGSTLIANNVSPNSFTLSWSPISDKNEVSYGIYIDSAFQKEQSTTSALINVFKPDTVANYKIEARFKNGAWTTNGPQMSFATPTPVVDNLPYWVSGSVLKISLVNDVLYLEWPKANSNNSTILNYILYLENDVIAILSSDSLTFKIPGLGSGKKYRFILKAKDANGVISKNNLIAEVDIPASNPQVVTIPKEDFTTSKPLSNSLDFLYKGEKPIQIGVAANTLDEKRTCLLKGRIKNSNNQYLKDVRVEIINHPEYGYTLTNESGEFNLLVNGGKQHTVIYTKQDFLKVQRIVITGWESYYVIPEVVMINRSSESVNVQLANTTQMTSIRGAANTDEHGSRSASIFIPTGTKANKVKPDGSLVPISTLNIRLTEYTVGPNGVKSMPGELPPTSGYTYAIELTADEVDAKVNGKDIVFDRDVYVCVNNFLNFPIGNPVPAGYYDDKKHCWIPSNDGRVIKILSVSNGVPQADIEGTNQSATEDKLKELNISEEERKKWLDHFKVGDSFWRIPQRHFSVWDYNWPFGPPPKAQPSPYPKDQNSKPNQNPCPQTKGSIISIQDQVLGQKVNIPRTGMSLIYQSDRVEGHYKNYSITFPISESTIPKELKNIVIEISILGRTFTDSLAPKENQTYTFIWDRKDSFGRVVQGSHLVVVKVGYTYDGSYQKPAGFNSSFGRSSGQQITGNRTRQEITMWNTWNGWIGNWGSRNLGLGGWTLDVHHVYDPRKKVVYFGNGNIKSSELLGRTISTFVGTGVLGFSGDNGPANKATIYSGQSTCIGPDGSIYIADWGNNRVRKVSPNGVITTIAGTGQPGYDGDGGLATSAKINQPHRVALSPDGTIYFTDLSNNAIRKIDTNGIISTIVKSEKGYAGDNGPIKYAQVKEPRCITLGFDGCIYFSDSGNHRVRKISPDENIITIAGNGVATFGGDGGSAISASLNNPQDVVLTKEGYLYICDQDNNRIRCISPDGIIKTVVGKGIAGYSGDNGKAIDACIYKPEGIAVDTDGTIYIADSENHCVRRVTPDGIITTIAGDGVSAYSGDNGLAKNARFVKPHAIVIAPDDTLYVSDLDNHRIRKLSTPLAGFSSGDLFIPSQDRSLLYVFNSYGRHLSTLDASTNNIILKFQYDPNGYLIGVSDNKKLLLGIERDKNGFPLRISNLWGQKFSLQINQMGYLSQFQDDFGKSFNFEYFQGGLMSKFTDPTGLSSNYEFDNLGKLTKAIDTAGNAKTFFSKQSGKNHTVQLTTAEGNTELYSYEELSNGESKIVNIYSCGNKIETFSKDNSFQQTIYSDGTIVEKKFFPDPQFGVLTPYTSETVTKTPSGLKSIVKTKRSLELTNPNDINSVKSINHEIDNNGNLTTFCTNIPDKKNIIKTAYGSEKITWFNDDGQVFQVQDELGVLTRYIYDEKGLLIETITGERNFKTKYNEKGWVIEQTDTLGKTIKFEYDERGRKIKDKFYTHEIKYSFKSNDFLTSMELPEGRIHSFTYNSQNLQESYQPPSESNEDNKVTYLYNQHNILTEVRYGAEAKIKFEYDCSARLQSVLKGNRKTSLFYDSNSGNLNKITSADGIETNYKYDGSTPLSIEWLGNVNGKIEFSYNPDFSLASFSICGLQPINVKYDSSLRISNIGNIGLQYFPNSHLIKETALNSIKESFEYDKYGGLSSSTYKNDEQELIRFSYLRDISGRITQINEILNGKEKINNFEYDDFGRITKWTLNKKERLSYSFDENGNRLLYRNQGNETFATYNKTDQILQFGGIKCKYNVRGDLIERTDGNGITKYQYDNTGNILSIELPDGKKIEYLLDGSERRVAKKINGKIVQRFIYKDGLNPIAELDENGNIKSQFIYATKVNIPDYMIRDSKTYRLISDHLGSIRLVVDSNTGGVIQKMDYDIQGNVLADSNPKFQPFGFAGGIYDTDTCLILFGARTYNPLFGCWMSKDPILFAGKDTNLYRYAKADPINYIDPTGNKCPDPRAAPAPTPNNQPKNPNPSDFTSLNTSIGPINLGGSVDKFGRKYVSIGVGVGWPPFSMSITDNSLLQDYKTTPEDIQNYMYGVSINHSAGALLGTSYTESPFNDTKFAIGHGIFSPQAGASINYTPNFEEISQSINNITNNLWSDIKQYSGIEYYDALVKSAGS